MSLAPTRTRFLLAFLTTAFALGGAFYLEYIVGLVPCPLCVVQLVLIAISAALCLGVIGQRPGPGGLLMYSLGLLVCAVAGAAMATFQIRLQSSPPEDLIACLVDVQYMLDNLSWPRVVWETLAGRADCAEINWSLFGITLPEWSLLLFIGLALFALAHAALAMRGARDPR